MILINLSLSHSPLRSRIQGRHWWPPGEVKISDTEHRLLVSQVQIPALPLTNHVALDRLWMGLSLRLTIHKMGIVSMVALGL